MDGIVFDIKRYAIHDGPGIRTTVFLKGCPLRCDWCQNPESRELASQISIRASRCIRCGACTEVCAHGNHTPVSDVPEVNDAACVKCGACVEACPTGTRSLVGRPLSVSRVLAEIDKDRLFYEESGGGVTFSGGEPLLQAKFLLKCLEACKRNDIHTAVDTCGYASADDLLDCAAFTDLFLYDLKVIDQRRHEELLGVSNALILENLKLLDSRGHLIWIRLPLIPGVNDDDENLAAIAEVVGALKSFPPVCLLPYHRIGSDKYDRLGLRYSMQEIEPPTIQRLSRVAERLSALGLHVTVGG